MTIRQLKTLVAIADAKTFSAAAEIVHVTHAAVSQQMQSLEADLGVRLFDRSPRTPVLTPIAHQIVAKSRKLIADYENLVPSVAGDGGLRGILTLGVMRTTLTGLVPRGVAAFKADHSDLSLHIRPGLTMPLLSDIKRGALDAAVVSRPHLLPVGVAFRDLTTEPMQLIGGPDETDTDPLTLLKTRPFIRFNRETVVGALIDTWIVSHGIKVSEAMELDSPEAIASMVHANLGVSILPRPAVQAAYGPPITEYSLGPDAPQRVLGLVHRENDPKLPALDALHLTFMQVIAAAQMTSSVRSSLSP